MTDYETRLYPLIEWSEVDCYIMEQDGWEQDKVSVPHGWIRYRRPLQSDKDKECQCGGVLLGTGHNLKTCPQYEQELPR